MPGKRLAVLGLLWVLLPCFVLPSLGAEAPSVSAVSAVLMDGESGRVLFAQNPEEPRAIASITKLMTALLAAETVDDWNETVTVQPEWTGIEGTSLYLKPGEALTLRTLLYGLLLQSGNDAAVALADICAGDTPSFVERMNRRAAEIGMTNTHFSDPNGLSDENHYSTALDMARLAAVCLRNPTVAEIVSTRTVSMEGRSLVNHNKLLWQYPGCIGMKTGYTRQAGRTLVSAARREGQTLICVTLCDSDDWADHTALLDYGFSAFPRQTLAERGEVLRRIPVEGSLLHSVPVTVRSSVGCALGEGETAAESIDLPERASAPLTAGTLAGSVTYTVGDTVVGTADLVWGKSVRRDVLAEKPVRSALDFLRRLGQKEPILEAFAALRQTM